VAVLLNLKRLSNASDELGSNDATKKSKTFVPL
jgi:hypothetical protein